MKAYWACKIAFEIISYKSKLNIFYVNIGEKGKIHSVAFKYFDKRSESIIRVKSASVVVQVIGLQGNNRRTN